VVHIDFGDCFEAAQHRAQFPEAVPFRLTRLLIGAMEVCGTRGTFEGTCESVLGVIRANRDRYGCPPLVMRVFLRLCSALTS
jgi:FKBP12-rapamycin complex-associated protein